MVSTTPTMAFYHIPVKISRGTEVKNLSKLKLINMQDIEVEDFTYEVIDSDTLRVNIEYSINAEEVKDEVKEEDLFKRVEEPELDKILDEIEADREESVDVSERDIADDAKNTILDSINNTDDAYITYHVHEMKETDTIESICIKYNTSKNIIEDYNDISNLSLGDKVIIPEVNE